MDELKKRLEEMEVPLLKDDPFQHELRRLLIAKFIPHRSAGRMLLRLGTALVVVLAMFGVVSVVNPGWAYKVNNMAFNKNEGPDVERLDLPSHLANSSYTSINNPEISNQIDPKQYVEDKSYVIRRYKSPRNGAVMIVSEFDERGKQVKTKLVNQSGM